MGMGRLQHLVLFALALAGAVALSARSPQTPPPPPVPPPVEQGTANCESPVYATDMLVCGDPALHALDSELARVLAGAAAAPASRWHETQAQWFARRSRCAFAARHYACAEAAYRERLAALDPVDPAAEQLAVRCDDEAVAAIALVDDRAVLFGAGGEVLGAGFADAGTPDWQPFLAVSRRKDRIAFKSLDGDALTCRTQGARGG